MLCYTLTQEKTIDKGIGETIPELVDPSIIKKNRVEEASIEIYWYNRPELKILDLAKLSINDASALGRVKLIPPDKKKSGSILLAFSIDDYILSPSLGDRSDIISRKERNFIVRAYPEEFFITTVKKSDWVLTMPKLNIFKEMSIKNITLDESPNIIVAKII